MPQRGPQIVLGEPKARVPNLNSAPLFFLGRAQPQFGRYRPADDTFHVFSHASSALSGASRSLPRKVIRGGGLADSLGGRFRLEKTIVFST